MASYEHIYIWSKYNLKAESLKSELASFSLHFSAMLHYLCRNLQCFGLRCSGRSSGNTLQQHAPCSALLVLIAFAMPVSDKSGWKPMGCHFPQFITHNDTQLLEHRSYKSLDMWPNGKWSVGWRMIHSRLAVAVKWNNMMIYVHTKWNEVREWYMPQVYKLSQALLHESALILQRRQFR